MASIRKFKKRPKWELKNVFAKKALSPSYPLFGFHGTTSIPQTPRNFKIVSKAEFLKYVDQKKHDVLKDENVPIPTEAPNAGRLVIPFITPWEKES